MRQHRASHLDEIREYDRVRYRTDPARRWSARRRLLGVDAAAFASLLQAQNNACAICRRDLLSLPPRQIQIDHDHESGRVRGILCHWCNTGLGLLGDDPRRIRRVLIYLKQ